MYTGGPWNDAISVEHRGMQCVMENPLDWDKKLRGFVLVMLNASFSMFQPEWRTTYPPDRIVIDCPTPLDPLVAVSVRGIVAIRR